MTGFILGGWPLFVAIVAPLAMGLLVGAALGYYTASTDLDRERSKAYSRGYADATAKYRRPRLSPLPVAVYDQDAPSAAAVAIELRGDN